MTIKNTDIAKELSLPPVKLHCSSELHFPHYSGRIQHFCDSRILVGLVEQYNRWGRQSGCELSTPWLILERGPLCIQYQSVVLVLYTILVSCISTVYNTSQLYQYCISVGSSPSVEKLSRTFICRAKCSGINRTLCPFCGQNLYLDNSGSWSLHTSLRMFTIIQAFR